MFDTGDTWPAQLSQVVVRSGDFIDAIGITQVRPDGGTIPANMHGGGGGGPSTFTLQPGERIIGIWGKYGQFVDSLNVKTDKGRTMKWGGSGGAVDYTYQAPPGCYIYGFWGRSGTYVDAIGAKFLCSSAVTVAPPPPAR